MHTIAQICRISNLMMEEVEVKIMTDLRTNNLYVGVFSSGVITELFSPVTSEEATDLYLDVDLEGFYER